MNFPTFYFLFFVLLFFQKEIVATKRYRSTFSSENYQHGEVSPTVKKDTVIKVKASLRYGARKISSEKVDDATECYKLCRDLYDTEGCNIAQMHYKSIDDHNIIKYCYLFSCGYPSLCVFKSNVSRFHVIAVNTPEQPIEIREEIDENDSNTQQLTTKQPEKTLGPSVKPHSKEATTVVKTQKKTEQKEEECPPGMPVAMCSDDPCKIHKCEGDSSATCKPNFCGGCNAKFYTKSGLPANCTVTKITPPAGISLLNQHNEEVLTIGEADYEEKPEEKFVPPVHEKVAKENHKNQDEYYQSDKRKWLDQGGEGIIGNVATSKHPRSTPTTQNVVVAKTTIVAYRSYFTIPLLIALVTCIALLCYVLYRYRCRRGKPKKFPVDDGDYLINGMYL